jgi:hypothetical protein
VKNNEKYGEEKSALSDRERSLVQWVQIYKEMNSDQPPWSSGWHH